MKSIEKSFSEELQLRSRDETIAPVALVPQVADVFTLAEVVRWSTFTRLHLSCRDRKGAKSSTASGSLFWALPPWWRRFLRLLLESCLPSATSAERSAPTGPASAR